MMTLDIDTQVWLRANMDPLAWAWGPTHGVGVQATAYYFRRLEDAQRFVDAFPQLELADGVRSPAYHSREECGDRWYSETVTLRG